MVIRHWQVGKWCDASTEFKPNQSIRIFDDMGELFSDEIINQAIFCIFQTDGTVWRG